MNQDKQSPYEQVKPHGLSRVSTILAGYKHRFFDGINELLTCIDCTKASQKVRTNITQRHEAHNKQVSFFKYF